MESSSLALALFRHFVQGAAVLLVALVAHRLASRRSAEFRYVLLAAAFAGLFALPAATRVTPPLEVALPVPERFSSRHAPPPAADAGSEAPRAAPAPIVVPVHGGAAVDFLPSLLVATWLAGALALVLRHAGRRCALARLVRRSSALEGGAFASALAAAARESGVRRRVRLVASPAAAVPLTFGARRPVIVLPEAARTWSDALLLSVLRHEMVHVRRLDSLVHGFAEIVRAAHWPNPLASIAIARLVESRERSCDDRVLASGERASSYARHLLAVADGIGSAPRPALAFERAVPAMARTPEIARRVSAILDERLPRTSVSARATAAALAMALLAIIPIAAARIAAAGGGDEAALDLARRLVSLRENEGAPIESLLDALGDDRAVDPESLAIQHGGPRHGDLPETTPGKEAARTLVARGGRDVEALLGALFDPRPAAREKAAWALGRIGDARAAEALERLVSEDAEARVRRIAAWALGEMGAISSRGTLEGALGDGEAAVRAQAAHALGDLRDPRAVEPLVAALLDPEPRVRERAAHALGDVGDARAGPALVRAAGDDSDPGVRSMAGWALDEIGRRAR